MFNNIFFFQKSCRLWNKVRKYCRAVKATDDNMAHAHCMFDTWGYKYTYRLCNTYCFSTATMVARTRPLLRYTYLACPVSLLIKLFLPLTRKNELIFSAPFSMLTWMQTKILLEIFRLNLSMLMNKACTRNARFVPSMSFYERCGCGFKLRGCDALSFSEGT
jgi:hypothetical protein